MIRDIKNACKNNNKVLKCDANRQSPARAPPGRANGLKSQARSITDSTAHINHYWFERSGNITAPWMEHKT